MSKKTKKENTEKTEKAQKKEKKAKKEEKRQKAEPTKVYLTPAEWGQIMATAWADAQFKQALEYDPMPAIRERFPTFEFERVLMLNDPPPGITPEQLERTARGEEIVIPDVSVGPHIYFHG